jgi:hypothetical protein
MDAGAGDAVQREPPIPGVRGAGNDVPRSGAFGDPPAPRDAVAVVVTAGVPCGLDGEQPEGSVVSSTVAIAEVVILTRRGRRVGLGLEPPGWTSRLAPLDLTADPNLNTVGTSCGPPALRVTGYRGRGCDLYTQPPVDASLRRALTEATGPDSVLEGGSVLAPASAEDVAAVLRIAQEQRLPLRLTSGAGDPVTAPEGGAVLSLARLAAVRVDASNGVARADAGATLTVLAAALTGAGMAVPGLSADPGSDHVGALIARGGVPRRSLTGIEAALPGGDLIRLGGSVLKDVVGYDITSLLLGSRGRLAAIIAVHLRLIPAAAAVEVAEPAGARDVGELTGVFDPEGILVGG